MSRKIATCFCVLMSLGATAAQATPISLTGPEKNLQQITDGMTTGKVSSVDVGLDQVASDAAFQIAPALDRAGSRILIELAGYAGSNRFGLYDLADTSNRFELFSGSDAAGAATSFSIDADGHVYRDTVDSGLVFSSPVFGLYLQTPAGIWYSDLARNADEADHMVAFAGQGDRISTGSKSSIWGSDTYLFGWEDLDDGAADHDFNDFVAFVSGIKPANAVGVPEPGSLALMGAGLLALAGFSRRKRA